MNFLKPTLTTVAFALSLSTSATAAEKIMIGEPTWTGAKVVASLIEALITEHLGMEAEKVTGTNPIIFKAMDRGKGDIDIHPDVWLPNISSLTDEYVDGRQTVALGQGSYEATAGFCVPTYVAEEHNIRSVYDLATPEAAALFDSDNDGKGEVWVGPDAWTASKIRQVKVRDYGIGSFFDTTAEEEAIAYAGLGSAIQQHEPIVFACYKPHFIFSLYDLTKLEEPPYDPEKYVVVQPDKDPDWFDKSTVKSGDPQVIARIAYSRSLETRAPQVASLLSRIDLDTDTVSDWTNAVATDKRDAGEVVREWIAAHPDQVNSWLGL